MNFLTRILKLCLLIFSIIVVVALSVSVVQNTWARKKNLTRDRVAVVELEGLIADSSKFLKSLKEATEDSHVKALVVQINSPGGLVGPSQEIFNAIKRVDEKIPVVTSISALGASGGYYAALGGRKIFANPGSLTASIGVIMELANLQGLYQWARIERFAITAGKLKDVGSESRKMTPEERKFLTDLLADIHRDFKAAVKDRRHLTPEELEASTDGRVMSGSQAKQAKLVDELGGLEEAVSDAKKLANLPETAFVQYPEEKRGGLLRRLVMGDPDEAHTPLEASLGQVAGSLIKAAETGGIFSPGWRVLLLAPVR